ncbi:sigma-54-dependent transcriptional regulator [Sphingosinicella soli]|uniref:DNA-binding transcriptional regulator NtrC n=1 Tax=Sphingosinicella soli TaxID=333708 RepID=A0A7W7F8C6_9SPHN|nr:sigma-54 dependent transcriptional regulator [Sphingosinicella soli]MBB4633532.1 DNA-binding NtrC family response regulator [Sphingosinicella soli]
MAKQTVLVVDDESGQRRITETVAARAGYGTVEAEHGQAALDVLNGARGKSIDAVILDYNMPGKTGIEVLRELRPQFPQLPVIMLTAHSSVSTAVEAMRAGASDFLLKPASPDRIIRALQSVLDEKTPGGELRPLTEKLPDSLAFADIVGRDAGFRAALAVAEKAAQKNVPILIEGESGVGKEVVAQAVHAASPRTRKPLVIVNCGALPSNLVESVLFGHEKGAFTGAVDRHVGRFGEADGGTLFLDEIGELPLDAQVKLLRALQTGQIEPVGGRGHVTVDVRLIAATNRNLAEEVREGRFREDLFYRLGVVPVTIPPLRARRGDIAALAHHFIRRLGAEEGVNARDIDQDALALLEAYGWPGNVRQLQNALFRAAVLCDGAKLTVVDFPQLAGVAARRPQAAPATEPARTASDLSAEVSLLGDDGKLRRLEDLEAEIIRKAIHHCRGRMSEVARRLGIGRSTLYRKLGEMAVTDDFGGHDDDVRNVA